MSWKSCDTLRAENQEGAERGCSVWEEWNPNTSIYSAAVHTPLHCKNDCYDVPKHTIFFKLENRYIRGLKCWNIIWNGWFSEFAFLISFLKRPNWKETSLSVWRKCTVLSSLPFFQPCTWAVWYLKTICSVEEQMYYQNKLHQTNLYCVVTKTCSGFTPHSTSVSQLVSSVTLKHIDWIKWIS